MATEARSGALTGSAVEASSPGKVILFGEHAINRGAPAVAAAVGIRARCRVAPRESGYTLSGGGREGCFGRDEILALAEDVDARRAASDPDGIRRIAAGDYFAPAKYILGSVLSSLPAGLDVRWESELPPSSGLGSGGAAFAALAAALRGFLDERLRGPEALCRLAHSGDVVAHGGIASALDTQTALLGGVRFFDSPTTSRPIRCAPGLEIVIGNTGVSAPTSEVNARVRQWASADPEGSAAVFRDIGRLAEAGRTALEIGDWPRLGELVDSNARALEQIGVTTPETERLVAAARSAGALGAKPSGSGGGGIVIAIVTRETREPVVRAIAAAGGTPLTPDAGVPGGIESSPGGNPHHGAP